MPPTLQKNSVRQVSGRSGLRSSAHPVTPDLVKFIKSGMLRLVRHVVRMQVLRNVYGVVVGKPEVKRRLATPKHRW